MCYKWISKKIVVNNYQSLLMENLNNLDLFTLVDMLAKYTNEYMKMLKDGTTDEEYARCKGMIKNLTAEIEYRKQKTRNAKNKRTAKEGIPK